MRATALARIAQVSHISWWRRRNGQARNVGTLRHSFLARPALGASGQNDGAAVEPSRLRRANSMTVCLISQARAPAIVGPIGEALISVDDRAARLALTVRTMAQMPGIIGKIAVYMPEK